MIYVRVAKRSLFGEMRIVIKRPEIITTGSEESFLCSYVRNGKANSCFVRQQPMQKKV